MTLTIWNELFHGYLSNPLFLLYCLAKRIVGKVKADMGDTYHVAEGQAGWDVLIRLLEGTFVDVISAKEANALLSHRPDHSFVERVYDKESLTKEMVRIVGCYSDPTLYKHHGTPAEAEINLRAREAALLMVTELIERYLPATG